jgi:hypothetical protein
MFDRTGRGVGENVLAYMVRRAEAALAAESILDH